MSSAVVYTDVGDGGPPGDDGDDGDGPSGRKDNKGKKDKKRDKRDPTPPSSDPRDDGSSPSSDSPDSADKPPKEKRRGRIREEKPKTKEAEKVAVPDFPTIAQLPQWKMQLLHNVVAASGREEEDEVTKWLLRVNVME